MYAFRTTEGPVDLAFTDRYGGVSGAPYEELNLAVVTEDDEEATRENTRRLLTDFAPGDLLCDLYQVHGGDVVVIDGPSYHARSAQRPQADALVTAVPGAVLMVRAADCVPVLIADPRAGVIGAAHSGRPGLVAQVVPHTVAAMRDLGATSMTAWIGPHVCGDCYEVPAAMQDDVAAVEPASRSMTSWGTPALDLGAGVRAQLERDGVRVVEVARCTIESDDLYSHRRDGAAAGRLAGLIRLRSEP